VCEVGRDNCSRFGAEQHFLLSGTLYGLVPRVPPQCNYQLSSMLTNLIICSVLYLCQSLESHVSLLKGTKTSEQDIGICFSSKALLIRKLSGTLHLSESFVLRSISLGKITCLIRAKNIMICS